jgi:hypothetical protein
MVLQKLDILRIGLFVIISFILLFTHEIGPHGVGEEAAEYLLRVDFMDGLRDVAIDLEPGLLQQARPHVLSLYRLCKQRHSVKAEHVVINEDWLLNGVYIHLEAVHAVVVGTSN